MSRTKTNRRTDYFWDDSWVQSFHSTINISNLFFRWALKHVTSAKSQFKAVLALNKYVLIELQDMYQRNLINL